MRRTVLALLGAAVILVASTGVAAAHSKSTGAGTFVIVQEPPSVVRQLGSVTYLRWSEEITFDGSLDGTASCTVHALQSATGIRFMGRCVYTGTVGDSDMGTASVASFGMVSFVDGSVQVRFSMHGESGGLAGLRLKGEVGPGTYTVTYRLAGV